MIYKTKEDLERVINKNKSDKVIHSFFVSYEQGLTYQEFLEKTKEEYYKLYPNDKEYIEYSDYILEDDKQTPNIPENPDELPIRPTLDLFTEDKNYQDIEVSYDDFKKFYSPYKIKQLNRQRDEELENMIVECSDNVWNANEISQTRISRAISVLDEDETTDWITADNKEVDIGIDTFKEILRKAGEKQTEIWLKYNNLKNEWR